MGANDGTVRVDGRTVTIDEVVAVADGAGARVTPDALERVAETRRVVERILESGRVVYGVNTGFGKLAEVRISPDQLGQLQLNLLRSHACGVGEPFPEPVVRAMLLLRANVLATGYAGCRPRLVEAVLDLLRAGVHPVVPQCGSVGASGDLAPLAHLALVLVGEGEAVVGGRRMPGADALAAAGLEPVELAPKEGLALINGTQASVAVLALAVSAARRILDAVDVVAAITVDATKGTDAAFDPAVQRARPHRGQATSAARIFGLLRGSSIRESHRDCHRVQDAYSLRCAPQVHGAARDAVDRVERVLSVEINSGTDNPMVFPDGRVISGGNFHGAPVAQAADLLATAMTDVASISERRLARLMDPVLSGLPAFLSEDPGLGSGFMMVQVSAAALVSEAKTLSHPASVDSIPTSAEQEDHVSMSTWAARKAARVVELARHTVAMEWLGAVQGIEFHRPHRSSEAIEDAVARLRSEVPRLERDRPFAPDIEVASRLLDALAEIG